VDGDGRAGGFLTHGGDQPDRAAAGILTRLTKNALQNCCSQIELVDSSVFDGRTAAAVP
jgi:hypothetical protein